MLTNRANLMAALEGEFPEYIPFTVNEEFCTSDVAVWEELYSAGLCRVNYTSDIQQHGHGEVERTQSHEHQNGYSVERTTLRTPVGSITQLALDGWVQEYYLKEARDYRVLEYIVRQQQLALVPEAFTTVDEALGARGITLIGAGRSPMQSILVDYAGLENFSYHLSEEVPELFALAEALDAQLIERCRLIARGPGRYVSLLENLTAEIWGAARFARFHLPVYERVLPILHAGGKKVFVHYDGKLACLAPLVGKTALDGVESLTMPPEGDMSYAEARMAMPRQVLWANINVSSYELPPEQLRDCVTSMARQGAPDGRHMAFSISEDCPRNWQTAIPVVLKTLKELEVRS